MCRPIRMRSTVECGRGGGGVGWDAIGGVSLGARKAGFESKIVLISESYAAPTQKDNFGSRSRRAHTCSSNTTARTARVRPQRSLAHGSSTRSSHVSLRIRITITFLLLVSHSYWCRWPRLRVALPILAVDAETDHHCPATVRHAADHRPRPSRGHPNPPPAVHSWKASKNET